MSLFMELFMATTIPQPVLTSEQLQAAMLDRRIILFTSDADRVQALRRYWRAVLQIAVCGGEFPSDFPALIGALALTKTQVTNDHQNAQAYVKNRRLSASLQACAAAIKAEQKRHHHVMQQKLAPDRHNAEAVLHSDSMIRLRDNHEAAQLAYQACSQFENGLRHLLDVREVVDELEQGNG